MRARLFLDAFFGKPPRRRWHIQQLTAGSHLIHLFDKISHTNFLVDTGAERSVLPHTSTATPTGPLLFTANNQPVPTWGIKHQQLQFGNQFYTFDFVLAQVTYPILGADFLAFHRLLVDSHNKQVIPANSLIPLPSSTTTASLSPLLTHLQSAPEPIRNLIASFPTVFNSNLAKQPVCRIRVIFSGSGSGSGSGNSNSSGSGSPDPTNSGSGKSGSGSEEKCQFFAILTTVYTKIGPGGALT